MVNLRQCSRSRAGGRRDGTMIVTQLQEKLKRFPRGAEVFVSCSETAQCTPVGNRKVCMRPVHSVVFYLGDPERVICLLATQSAEGTG